MCGLAAANWQMVRMALPSFRYSIAHLLSQFGTAADLRAWIKARKAEAEAERAARAEDDPGAGVARDRAGRFRKKC